MRPLHDDDPIPPSRRGRGYERHKRSASWSKSCSAPTIRLIARGRLHSPLCPGSLPIGTSEMRTERHRMRASWDTRHALTENDAQIAGLRARLVEVGDHRSVHGRAIRDSRGVAGSAPRPHMLVGPPRPTDTCLRWSLVPNVRGAPSGRCNPHSRVHDRARYGRPGCTALGTPEHQSVAEDNSRRRPRAGRCCCGS